ncbi:MAG: hypothetical protein HQ517_14445 [SAR324 cluster bacterium]|nr:hypothetical protein [SAR324 cluster bacterium]
MGANPVIPTTAIAFNMIILGGFFWVKITSDPFVLIVAAAFMAVILIVEFFFLRQRPADDQLDAQRK